MYPILAHSFTPLVSSSCINVLPLFPYLQLASCPSLAEILPPLRSFPSCLSWHTSLHVTQHSDLGHNYSCACPLGGVGLILSSYLQELPAQCLAYHRCSTSISRMNYHYIYIVIINGWCCQSPFLNKPLDSASKSEHGCLHND